jgi:hypothetical protein
VDEPRSMEMVNYLAQISGLGTSKLARGAATLNWNNDLEYPHSNTVLHSRTLHAWFNGMFRDFLQYFRNYGRIFHKCYTLIFIFYCLCLFLSLFLSPFSDDNGSLIETAVCYSMIQCNAHGFNIGRSKRTDRIYWHA